jgi:Dyp-type peroxidase family
VFQTGVLPDSVIKDPRAEAALVFLQLDAQLDQAQAQEALAEVNAAVAKLEQSAGGRQRASAAIALGETFFGAPSTPRFGISAEQVPAGFREPIELPGRENLPGADILVYVMTLEEAALAEFLQDISNLRGRGLVGARIERGYQRDDKRELFGNLDGLRNVPWRERFDVVFVDREAQAGEPPWTEDGTYLAYLKIRQRFDIWQTLSDDDKHAAIGRRIDDGSRLDLAPGSNPREEGDFAGDPPAPNSHIRKVGPHGAHDDVAIFRRGVPYFDLDSDAGANGGLHFVSFQCAMRNFDLVFNEWMLLNDFPHRDAGVDRLIALGLITFELGGVFFVPAADPEFVGAALFRPSQPDPRPRDSGRVHVRKHAVDASGNRVRADLDGIVFQVTKPGGTPVGEQFESNSAGHAVSGFLPIRHDYLLKEVSLPSHLEATGDVAFHLERRQQVVEITNRRRPESPYSG